MCMLFPVFVFTASVFADEPKRDEPQKDEAKKEEAQTEEEDFEPENIILDADSLSIDRNSAKFYEYNGLKKRAFADIFLDINPDGYYHFFSGENIGRDDQSYVLSGRKWDEFRYSVYYNETPHNYSFDARTFYSNIGSTSLTYPYANVPADPSQWAAFDYKIKNKDIGASIEYTAKEPFYVTAGFNRLSSDGIYPIGATSGVLSSANPGYSPFGNVVEIPAPVNYTTTNGSIEFGYRSKSLFLSLTGQLSKFDNPNKWLTFQNPFVASQSISEAISLPPDNNYSKIRLAGSLKLPLDSVLAVNAGYSRLTSKVSLLNTIWTSSSNSPTDTPTYTLLNLGLNSGTFNGDVASRNLSATLTSNPTGALSGRVYYKYAKRSNNSDIITYTNTVTGTTFTSTPFGYEKNNAGLELGYKITGEIKASAGYDHMRTARNRIDIPETKDNAYFIQVEYSPLEFLETGIKYQRLNRTASFIYTPASPTDPAYINNFIGRYDAIGKNQDAIDLSVDVAVEHVNLSLEYAYKKDRYPDTVLGVTDARRNEYILDATYEMKHVRLFGYFDYETVNSNQTSRYVNATGNYSFDPNTPPVENSYNWSVNATDNNYAYGAGAEIPLSGKITLFAQYDYQSTKGNADFTSQVLTGSQTQDSIDIPSYGDYRKQTISARVRYNAVKDLKFTLGYSYEKLDTSDSLYQGYQYVTITDGFPSTYLSGAYKDNSYRANIVYLKASYTF